jgi:chemotaxis-related protein WspB
VPVIDLHHLLGAGDCPPFLSSRIILVPYGPDPEELLGLLATQVADVRTLEPPPAPAAQLTDPDQPSLGAILADGSQVLHLLDPDTLLPAGTRRQLAGLSWEMLA